MSGIAKLEETLAKMEAALDEIREATREAHSATKELRSVERSVRDLLQSDGREMVEEVVRSEFERLNSDLAASLRAVLDESIEFVKASASRVRAQERLDLPPI